MLRNKIIKTHLSVLIALMYFFLILFSSSFHQHSHGVVSNFNFSSKEKVISHSLGHYSANDCIACHFLTNKTGFIPDEFQLNVPYLADFSPEESILCESGFNIEFFYFSRRGPPSFIINKHDFQIFVPEMFWEC